MGWVVSYFIKITFDINQNFKRGHRLFSPIIHAAKTRVFRGVNNKSWRQNYLSGVCCMLSLKPQNLASLDIWNKRLLTSTDTLQPQTISYLSGWKLISWEKSTGELSSAWVTLTALRRARDVSEVHITVRGKKSFGTAGATLKYNIQYNDKFMKVVFR